MIRKIKRLKADVINKIAAGEVIENPASVIKECVENSLDAGASDITVEIKGGGRQLIRVTDNGCGMDSEDALLCLERHATSKIADIDDLSTLHTMGFRGEAIASIASISKFKLLTRRPEDPVDRGTLVMVEGGRLVQSAAAACSAGTSIEIHDLFYNVPVRKKFLKSPAQDGADVFKVMSLMALSHPQVAFHLIRDGAPVLSAPVADGTLADRVGAVLGKEFLEGCLPIQGEGISGFIGTPSVTRHNRLGQYLFINKRAVFSPVISRAVRDGYGTTIPPARYPVFVLYMEMPSFDVDVNVHPQKREVRLRNEEEIIDNIRKAVTSALRPKEELRRVVAPKFLQSGYAPDPVPAPTVREPAATYAALEQEVKHPEFNWSLETAGPEVLATIKGYILAQLEGEEGILVVDQKRAHSRVLFEILKKGAKEPHTQSLTVPVQIDLTPVEAEAMRQRIEQLEQLGFHIREFGGQSFLVDAIPQSFSNIDVETMIRDIVEDLQVYPLSKSGLQDQQLASMAARGAVSSKTQLSRPEAAQLLRRLWNEPETKYCPAGKPIWIHLDGERLREMI